MDDGIDGDAVEDIQGEVGIDFQMFVNLNSTPRPTSV